MLRKIKQKGESAILHWMLREDFSDKVVQDQGPERHKRHGRGRAFRSEEAANAKALCE